jgi:hypothetical protein
MKIRAAIANMTISTDGPILTTETILARRRLSSEETRTETLKTTGKKRLDDQPKSLSSLLQICLSV